MIRSKNIFMAEEIDPLEQRAEALRRKSFQLLIEYELDESQKCLENYTKNVNPSSLRAANRHATRAMAYILDGRIHHDDC